ncbi:MAG: permease [Deltaproteobacteria bacterium]|jgi:uncharacterized membrane protein YraQ (UPF0718 family)|nr:permease [Deltaproteobacteria bacterium]
MLEQLTAISDFVINSFFHIWPYLLVTIPLAVMVQMSGASRYIKRAFQARPMTAILLATVVGAFSPFCSCGVIPVIASLLISGVPLAPVMSFWIASPSMDPEIFFLSVGMIGRELAVWRLAATLVLSLGAGVITHIVMTKGWLGQRILQSRKPAAVNGSYELIKKGWLKLRDSMPVLRPSKFALSSPSDGLSARVQVIPNASSSFPAANLNDAPACTSCATDLPVRENPWPLITLTSNPEAQGICCGSSGDNPETFVRRLLKETLRATLMVAKFMALAFFLEAIITLYIPREWITTALGHQNPLVIVTAAFLGIPTYTTSLTALPMISGLLTQGMSPAAALAFLVAGPTTTLPAMAAVWPLVARRVFVLYISFALLGAILIGYIYKMMGVIYA